MGPASVNHHERALFLWKSVDVEAEDDDNDVKVPFRVYVILLVMLLFTVVSLTCWAASVTCKPKVFVKSMVFDNFNVQSGTDATGVPTDMLTLNTTVQIFYRNPAKLFGVHVTITPIEIHYFQLKLASGRVTKFYQSRKSQRVIVSHVLGYQKPLYGGVSPFNAAIGRINDVIIPVNLTFSIKSRAYILGRLVSPKLYKNVLCQVILHGNQIGMHVNLTNSCIY